MRRARGEGSIFSLPDGRFAAEVSLGYDHRGIRRRQRVSAKTRGEVREKLLALQDRIRKGEHAAAPRKTAARWLTEEWLPVIHARRRGSTAGDYERTVKKYLAPWLGKRALHQIKATDLERWYVELRDAGVGPRAIAKAHATLRAALAYAVRVEAVGKNVATQIEPPAYAPTPRRRYSIEQVVRFLEAARGHPGEALFTTAIFTQLRNGELFALRWEDLDLRERVVRVERTMTDDRKGKPTVGATTKTRAGQRTIVLPKRVVAALREQRKAILSDPVRAGSGLVFPNEAGNPLSRANVGARWLHPLQEKAGVPKITFHELRHTGASILRDLGGDLLALRDRLGHESESTTADIYVLLDLDAQRRLSDLLDKRFAAPVKSGMG